MNALNHLPKNARIWIYAADHLLSSTEKDLISQRTSHFIQGWTAHEIPVDASFSILHDCFLIIAVNEDTSDISGCGIDKSFGFIKALGTEMNTDFLNRMQIEILSPHGLMLLNKSKTIEGLSNGSIQPEWLTFDKSCTRLSELDTQFSIPVNRAWYYPKRIVQAVTEK